MLDPDAVPAALPGAPGPLPGSDAVDWITHGTQRTRSIRAAIPPVFAAHATVVIPADDGTKTLVDAALVDVLRARTAPQRWWLGYLDTGVAGLVLPAAPSVSVYAGWPYALVDGGPEQALAIRRNRDATSWHSALPELLFPADRSWLVSTMWDDDWRCIGGPVPLIDALLRAPLEARRVGADEDATPPGHTYG